MARKRSSLYDNAGYIAVAFIVLMIVTGILLAQSQTFQQQTTAVHASGR